MNRVLLIRTDFLGDCILSSVFIEMLSRQPSMQIDVIATRYNNVAFQYNPKINHLFVIDHNPSNKLYQDNYEVLSQIKFHYDIVIILNRDLRNYRYLKYLNYSKVFGHRLGRKSFKSNLFCLVYGLLPKYNFIEYNQSQHEVTNQVNLLNFVYRSCNALLDHNTPKRVKFYLSGSESISKFPDSVVINISGRAGSHRYLNDSMILALVNSLKDKFDRIALVAVPSEYDRLNKLIADLPDDINIICEHDVFAVAKQITKYELFIGCDGGLLHIAAGLDLKLIAIFHDQKIAGWHPWSEHYVCIQAVSKNIYDVSYVDVLNALDSPILNK